MNLTKSRNRKTISMNMTPMIDVVFLLIIFFMTVSQLSNRSTTAMTLPVLKTADRFNAATELLLQVDRNGTLHVNGKTFSAPNYRQFFETQSLSQKRAQKRAQPTATQPTENLDILTPQQPRVRLRCDADCSTTHINSLFKQLSRFGYQRVSVAVRERDH